MDNKTRSKKQLILEIILFIVVGLLVSFLANILLDWLHSDYNWDHVMYLLEVRSRVYVLSTLIVFVLYAFFASLSSSRFIASSVVLLTAFCFGITSNMKMLYRGEPLYPMELRMITEVPFLIEMIGFREAFKYFSLLFLFLTAVLVIYLKLVRKKELILTKRNRLILRGVGVVLTAGLLMYVRQFNEMDHRLKAVFGQNADWVTYDQPRNYENNGFLPGFLFNIEAAPMEPIEGYSRATIEEIVDRFEERAREINQVRANVDTDTNVIFIMNETYSDPLRMPEFSSNEDPIPFYRELAERTVSGQALAQGIGGGTANSEFEALTTMAIEPFAPTISTPYVQLTDQMPRLPSIVSLMKEMGHHTTAIHSHSNRLYKRVDTYNGLGFDEFIYDQTMRERNRIDESPFISDESAYNEVLAVLEDTDGSDFIHLVTMQNHTPWSSKHSSVDFETEGSENPEEANAYLQDLYYSDQAFESFIGSLEDFEEPTLLVYWGDHLPAISVVYGSTIGAQSTPRQRHETPLLIFSNEEERQAKVGTLSPIFYSNYVLEFLDLTVSPYHALLYDLEQLLPAFKDGLYIEGSFSLEEHVDSREELSEEAQELLDMYHYIQYDLTTGSRYASQLGFFDRLDIED